MSDIRIKKGLNINLKGKAEKVVVITDLAETYALKPDDFIGITPKLFVKQDDIVKAGGQLFFDKKHPEIIFTSPVSGRVISIERGDRRSLLEIIIKPDSQIEYEDFGKADINALNRDQIIEKLLKSGLWPCIKQRPYAIIAKPTDTPKAIFISTFDSAPLAPDYDFVLQNNAQEFQTGIDALAKLTNGKVHLNIDGERPATSVFTKTKNVQINKFSGPHPTGNVGIQIHHINPINKGEVIWVVNPQDVVSIGRLFEKGIYDATITIALAGSEVKSPKYFKVIKGFNIQSIVNKSVLNNNARFISGNVLTGKTISSEGHLGFYDHLITVIPEGNHFEFLGWALPGLKKFSASKAFFSWICKNREYALDTNFNGGHRAFVMTGQYEKVLPMEIYPLHLLKAILAEDIDLMENLGIYEVAEEDFALCEFVCTSKTEIQEIIRQGLDMMVKEMN